MAAVAAAGPGGARCARLLVRDGHRRSGRGRHGGRGERVYPPVRWVHRDDGLPGGGRERTPCASPGATLMADVALCACKAISPGPSAGQAAPPYELTSGAVFRIDPDPY